MQKTILIVEDDELSAVVAREILTGHGFAVRVVATGVAAIEAAELSCPDAVVMDVTLPGPLNGIETARRLTAKHGTPVIFVTALDEDTFRSNIRDTPYVSMLRKPFSMVEFLETVRRAAAAS